MSSCLSLPNFNRNFSGPVEPVAQNNSYVQIHPKTDNSVKQDKSDLTFNLPNLSSFCDNDYEDMLVWAIDMLRVNDVFSIVSDKDEIDEIEKILSDENASEFEVVATLVELGDSLLLDSFYDGAYYFYFVAVESCDVSLDPDSNEVKRKALLQIAKLMRVNHITSEQHDTQDLANRIFKYLSRYFDCEESKTFRTSEHLKSEIINV
jgi:hypothetical protein